MNNSNLGILEPGMKYATSLWGGAAVLPVVPYVALICTRDKNGPSEGASKSSEVAMQCGNNVGRAVLVYWLYLRWAPAQALDACPPRRRQWVRPSAQPSAEKTGRHRCELEPPCQWLRNRAGHSVRQGWQQASGCSDAGRARTARAPPGPLRLPAGRAVLPPSLHSPAHPGVPQSLPPPPRDPFRRNLL